MTTGNRKTPAAQRITIIGGGLAGAEAAWQAARRGVRVLLLEMKPQKFSPAHHSPRLGELVCSNSLRAEARESAVGLLKEEMRRLGSLILAAAEATRVPAGRCLAVDREAFAAEITQALEQEPLVEIVRQEVTGLDLNSTTVVASGPLTSEPLAAALGLLGGREHLHFYDAIAPTVAAASLDPGPGNLSGLPATGPGRITSTAPSAKQSMPPFTRPCLRRSKCRCILLRNPAILRAVCPSR